VAWLASHQIEAMGFAAVGAGALLSDKASGVPARRIGERSTALLDVERRFLAARGAA
jgi:hypothetical protein